MKSTMVLLFLMVMAMKSKMGDDVYDDPGMSTSATQRGVMLRIMIEKQPIVNTNTNTNTNANTNTTGMSTSGTQRGVMVRIMIEKQPS